MGLVLAGIAVHTTGVNWEGVLAVVSSLTIVLAFFSGIIIYLMKNAIRSQITAVIASEVTPVLAEIQVTLRNHDTRIARLEGVEEGKAYAVAAAGVTTNPGS